LIGLKKDTVALVLIEEKDWKKTFDKEKVKLCMLLENKFIAIEHIGSTAIPGILAKPIVDIAIGIKDMKDANSIKSILEIGGYEYRPDNGNEGRLLFIKVEQDKRTHHLHVEEYCKESWNNHINFRDCLLKSSDLRYKYMELKILLAEKYPIDRKQYTDEKAEFIQKVLSSYKYLQPSSGRKNELIHRN